MDVSDAPADYMEKMMGAIVGIEIEITRLSGKWKLSQNQPASNRAGVVDGLRARSTHDALETAEWMDDNEAVP
jgi:transcriptional regulator